MWSLPTNLILGVNYPNLSYDPEAFLHRLLRSPITFLQLTKFLLWCISTLSKRQESRWNGHFILHCVYCLNYNGMLPYSLDTLSDPHVEVLCIKPVMVTWIAQQNCNGDRHFELPFMQIPVPAMIVYLMKEIIEIIIGLCHLRFICELWWDFYGLERYISFIKKKHIKGIYRASSILCFHALT